MKKKAVIMIIALFVCLGLADLITTFHGFSLGLIESDGIFIPFGFSIVSIVCVLTIMYFSGKGLVHNLSNKFVIGWFTILSCFPIIGNLVLIL